MKKFQTILILVSCMICTSLNVAAKISDSYQSMYGIDKDIGVTKVVSKSELVEVAFSKPCNSLIFNIEDLKPGKFFATPLTEKTSVKTKPEKIYLLGHSLRQCLYSSAGLTTDYKNLINLNQYGCRFNPEPPFNRRHW